jgi:hypothetical protein
VNSNQYKYLRAVVSQEDVQRLIAYPAPTYVVGIEEQREKGYIVSVNDPRSWGFGSLPMRFPLGQETGTFKLLLSVESNNLNVPVSPSRRSWCGGRRAIPASPGISWGAPAIRIVNTSTATERPRSRSNATRFLPTPLGQRSQSTPVSLSPLMREPSEHRFQLLAELVRGLEADSRLGQQGARLNSCRN